MQYLSYLSFLAMLGAATSSCSICGQDQHIVNRDKMVMFESATLPQTLTCEAAESYALGGCFSDDECLDMQAYVESGCCADNRLGNFSVAISPVTSCNGHTMMLNGDDGDKISASFRAFELIMFVVLFNVASLPIYMAVLKTFVLRQQRRADVRGKRHLYVTLGEAMTRSGRNLIPKGLFEEEEEEHAIDENVAMSGIDDI